MGEFKLNRYPGVAVILRCPAHHGWPQPLFFELHMFSRGRGLWSTASAGCLEASSLGDSLEFSRSSVGTELRAVYCGGLNTYQYYGPIFLINIAIVLDTELDQICLMQTQRQGCYLQPSLAQAVELTVRVLSRPTSLPLAPPFRPVPALSVPCRLPLPASCSSPVRLSFPWIEPMFGHFATDLLSCQTFRCVRIQSCASA